LWSAQTSITRHDCAVSHLVPGTMPPGAWVSRSDTAQGLCEPYLRAEYGEDFDAKAPLTLLERWQYGLRETTDEQVVVLSQVLAHASNVGYEHLNNMLVSKVNEQKVHNLRHLVEAIETNRDRFVRFDLAPYDEAVVLEAATLPATTEEIMRVHNIPESRSDDLRAQ